MHTLRFASLLIALALTACGGGGGGGDDLLFTESFDDEFPGAWTVLGGAEIDTSIGVPVPSLVIRSTPDPDAVITTELFPTDGGVSLKVEVRPAPGTSVDLVSGGGDRFGVLFQSTTPPGNVEVYGRSSSALADFDFDGLFHTVEIRFQAAGVLEFFLDGVLVGTLNGVALPPELAVALRSAADAGTMFFDEVVLRGL